jgi:hypothetical protein
MTLSVMYQRLGWTEGTAYQHRKHPHLRLRVAAQMGMALEVRDLGAFLAELAAEEGVPALYHRLVEKATPEVQRKRSQRWKWKREPCEKCGSRAHRTARHTGSEASPEVAMLKARASAKPRARLHKSKRNRA